MVICTVSNKLIITGLPKSIKNYYKNKCVYNISLYANNEDDPEVLKLCDIIDSDTISIPRGLLTEFISICNTNNLKIDFKFDYNQGEDHKYTISPKIRYREGPYGFQGQAVDTLLRYKVARLQGVCGSGKMVMACLITALLGKGPVLYLAGTDRLLNQFKLTVEKVLGVSEKEIGVIKAKKFDIKPITVGSLRTLGKEDFDIESIKNTFQTLFYDECHLSTAITYRRVLLGLSSERLYGFSATPNHPRSEDLNYLMDSFLGPIVVNIKDEDVPKRLIPKTYTRYTGCDFYYGAFPCDNEWKKRASLNNVYKKLGNSLVRNNLIVSDSIKLIEKGYKVLICIVRTDQGKNLHELFAEKNISCSFPYKIKENKDGDIMTKVDHKKFNKDVLEIERGNIDVLIGTYQLMGTGFDCPSLSALLWAAPFSGNNTTQIVQSVGRIQRFQLDKKYPLVLDYTDHSDPVDLLEEWSDKRATYLQKRFGKHDIIS